MNALLGTLHQNAAIPNTALKLLHSATLRIGDPPRRPPEVDVFGNWLLEYQRTGPGRGLRDVRTQLTATAPPGVARMLSDALAGFDEDWEVELPPDVVRGLAKVQVSSVTMTVPDGSSSEVIVNASIRAHYYPDPGTTVIPTHAHGDLRIAFDVRRVQRPSGIRLLIQPSSQDSKIQFTAAPGTGLDAAAQNRIAAEIRKVLREGLTQVPVDLPANFPFADFKGLASGSSQAIALPFQLSGAAPPAGGLQSLTQSFVGPIGFAFAVSKEYVISLIDIEAIRAAMARRSEPVLTATYRFRFSSGPTLTFRNGGIEISGQVEAESNRWWAPNGFVRFRQLVTLVLDVPNQTVGLERVGDPDVSLSFLISRFISHGRALSIVITEIDRALRANAPSVRRVFSDGKNSLVRGLRTFDPAATVSYTALQITPDGVIVRGDIGSVARRAPVVHIAETHNGAAFTAFQSWIPAGRIDRFIWSWVERTGATIWSGVQRSVTDEHSFIFPKPPGLTEISQICLRIEGTRISRIGAQLSAAAGTTCEVPEPEFAIDAPSWWGPVTLPIWRPDLKDTAPLRDAIAGHVGILNDVPEQEPFSRNVLVYFADWRSERPLDALHAALGRLKDKSAPMVIVVLPAGAFDSSRREFENRLPRESVGAPIHFTEDIEGAWTRMFAVAKTPSVYLISTHRKFVWKHEGEPDPSALAAALDKHARRASVAAVSSAALGRFTRRFRARRHVRGRSRRAVRASSFPRTSRAFELLAIVVGALPCGAGTPGAIASGRQG